MIGPEMAAGNLPNLARLAEAGTHGKLASIRPLLSPIVWTSVATGKTPQKHGIHGWVHPNAEGNAELYYSRDRVTHALWNILSDAGFSLGVVNWLVTYPPEIINGIMVTDHTYAGELKGKAWVGQMFGGGRKLEEVEGPASGTAAVYPASWAANAIDRRHDSQTLTSYENPFVETAVFPALVDVPMLSSFFLRDSQLTSVALQIDDAISPDVLMVLLQGIDRVSHSLWACYEDPSTYPPTFQPSPEELATCREAMIRYYRYSDALLGELLERFDENDLIIVLSDHGFESIFTATQTGGHDSEEASYGIIFAKGPGIPAAQETTLSVYDIAPTILAWLKQPLADDFDGKVAPFLDVELRESIPTYDTKLIPRVGEDESGLETSVMDQLRKLGYVE